MAKKVSGKGDIGTTCPKCGKILFFEDQEYDGDYVIDTVYCADCWARFTVCYKAVDWEEV
jgi:uncharacterized Zn finger protein (UPF0148 family)